MLRQLFIKISGLLCGLICLTATAEHIQYWQTPQGTPVYFVEAPDLPMVDVRVIFTAGSAYDQNQWGIASLTAAALNEGTKAHNADQIADALELTGAQYECDTDRDVTILGLRSLSDSQYLTPALKMFNEILGQANFPDSALSRLKQQTLAAIRQEQQDPYEVAKNAFFSHLYPDQPYGHAILGNPSTVTAITRSQVQEFYQRFFNSSDAKIILVGNLQRPIAEQIAAQLMEVLPKGTPAPALAQAKNLTTSALYALKFPSQQTSIITGQLGIDRQNSEYFPLMVGNYLLGQLPMASELFEHVRNQGGLAYGASSGFILMSYRGPFMISLQTRTAKKTTALKITQEVLQKFVTQGPEPEKLQLTRQYIINHFPLTLATNSQITNVLTQMAINERPLDYLDTYQSKVNAVTPAEVKQAFQATVKPDQLLTVTVGQ